MLEYPNRTTTRSSNKDVGIGKRASKEILRTHDGQFLVPEMFVSEFSGEHPFQYHRDVSVEKATHFHGPSSNQEVDLNRLDNAVVDEEHDLNQEGQHRGVVRWLGIFLSLILFVNVLENNCSLASYCVCPCFVAECPFLVRGNGK